MKEGNLSKAASACRHSLDEKYENRSGKIWINGNQALLRLLLEQSWHDKKRGIKSAGFVSGYRGSPLGGIDQQLLQEEQRLSRQNIVFQPGINEDLAATAVWGTQQTGLFPKAKFDGIYAMWYGKAPGLDRSTDAIRHANMAGTDPNGGVLAIVGDDPACKSSTLPSASVGALAELHIPTLVPSDVGEIVDLGLLGWAMSRYSGCWVALNVVTSIMDAAASIELAHCKAPYQLPSTSCNPHIRLADTPLDQEARIHEKLELARAFAYANGINRIVSDTPNPRLALVTAGKIYTDLRQVLADLGFGKPDNLRRAGVRLVKLGMVWPLDAQFLEHSLANVDTVVVIEGKGTLLEEQLKQMLYGKNAPSIVGKTHRELHPRLSQHGDPSFVQISALLKSVFDALNIDTPTLPRYLEPDAGADSELEFPPINQARKPLYCPGCPHSVSTRVPEGSRALAGIGCHYMAQWMDRETYTFTHMGGEGANWIGQAPFTNEDHVFVNLGDGTYSHSALLAIRAAVAAKVNVTYKILFNDAVAMTGGQAVEGDLSVDDVVNQVIAEGVSDVHVVSDAPSKHRGKSFKISHRDEINEVQEKLRATQGCTVMVYDQPCANELRRKIKRGLVPKKTKHVVINDAVCEGCGNCTEISMCSAIEPVDTDFGGKRRINQTSCNQDLTCVKGFCPALVQVEGDLLVPERTDINWFKLPATKVPIPSSADILITGVGGTGIVTLSQVLGMAATIEGKQAATLDMTGLAQKGGAVFAHVRIGAEDVIRTSIPEGQVDLLIAADPVTATSMETHALVEASHTKAVVNSHLIPTSKFVLGPGQDESKSKLLARLESTVDSLQVVDADRLAARVTGGSTTANMALLGFAWQHGLIPLTAESIESALELNGTKVEDNLHAFRAGRLFAHDMDFMNFSERPEEAMYPKQTRTVEELLADRLRRLQEYQDVRYSQRLKTFAERMLKSERRVTNGETNLTEKFIHTYYALLATKDEYEVARLLTHSRFDDFLNRRFQDNYTTSFGFAPTWLPGSQNKKVIVGQWALPLLKALAKLKFLRGSLFDPFRFSTERKFERQLRVRFESVMDAAISNLNERNIAFVEELVQCFAKVKGYGHIKQRAWNSIRPRINELTRLIERSTPKPRHNNQVNKRRDVA